MTYYDEEVWLVVGDSQNWGRGETFKDALSHALKNGLDMRQAHVYRLQANSKLKFSDLWCDELGNVAYSLKTEAGEETHLQKLPRWNVPASLAKAFTAFDDAVEDIRYGTQFDAVFDV